MPKDADPKDVWHAITVLRQWSGEEVGLNENRSIMFWTNLSAEGRQKVRAIMKRSEEGSLIGRYVSAFGYTRAFLEFQIDSLRLALSLDGYRIGYEAVRSIFTGSVRPRTTVEKVVQNYFNAVVCEANGQGGAGDVLALFAKLTQGVPEASGARWDTEVLKNLSRSLSDASRASDEMALSTVRYIWGAGRDIYIVDMLQSTFASLLRKAYLVRSGHPNLIFVPLSAKLRAGQVPRAGQPDFDMSQGVGQLLDVMLDALDELEMAAEESLERLQDTRARLENAATLNYRQKALLAELLTNPGGSFLYREIEKKFQVSYNTVRNDVSQLVRMGLLLSSEQNGYMVVCGAPNLIDAIGFVD